MSQPIFLAKNGQVFGPLSEAEFVDLKTKGELSHYSWMREGETGAWKPIDSPPPEMNAMPLSIPSETPHEESRTRKEAEVISIQTRKPLSIQTEGIELVAHDYRIAISGQLSKAQEQGCEMLTQREDADPGFSPGSKVILNLLETKSGKSISLPVEISKIRRVDGNWVYSVTWEQPPELLVKHSKRMNPEKSA